MYTSSKFSPPQNLSGLSHIADKYDGFIIDLWGTIHDGKQTYPGAQPCIDTLYALKKPVVFLSNSSRSSVSLVTFLHQLHIPVSDDHIITSGDLIRRHLATQEGVFKTLGSRVYHLEESKNPEILSGMPVQITPSLKEADYLLVTTYEEDEGSLNRWDTLFKEAISRNLPLVCANPDKIAHHAGKKRYTAGTFAARYETLGGKAFYYGKPFPISYQAAFEVFKQSGVTNQGRILAIGDSLETDIQGAWQNSIDGVLLMTGIHAPLYTYDKEGFATPESLYALWQTYPWSPQYIMPDLRWE